MWSDEIDKKIRKTTEGSQSDHAYNDKAWNKMEELLEKHLPQKRSRRFIPLLLLPLALVVTGIFFALQKQSKDNITGENIIATQPISDKETLPKDTEIKTATTKPGSVNINDPAQISEKKVGTPGNKADKTGGSRQPAPGQIKLNDKKVAQQRSQPTNELIAVDENKPAKKEQEKDFTEEITAPNKNIKGSTPLIPAPENEAAGKTDSKEKKDANQPGIEDQPTKANSPKAKSSPGSNFSINISMGPDFSSVNFDEPGEWKMQYGVGISYALSKKISLRTGFFTGRKIYTAGPEDYHSGYNPPPSLQKIEANCLVHEIPVNLIYSFSTRKKHNWFVAGGLSSYLMKEETYDYLYKDAWGNTQYYTSVYKNENSHFFSVINLSGGYQYHISDRFSLMAEPYVKIPLSGVGQGKVNLNSAGILFTAGFKPFIKKN